MNEEPTCTHPDDALRYVELMERAYYRDVERNGQNMPMCDADSDSDPSDDSVVTSRYFVCLDCGKEWDAAPYEDETRDVWKPDRWEVTSAQGVPA